MASWAALLGMLRGRPLSSNEVTALHRYIEVSGGPPRSAILGTLQSLRGLAEADRSDFETYPGLLEEYADAIDTGRFLYVPDPETCGLPDCWSTFLALRERYRGQRILGDCEDFACAHAAYLKVQGLPALIGLRPGRRIAHAVCAIEGPGGDDNVVGAPDPIIDPSVDFGMPELRSYDGIYWTRVRSKGREI